MKTKHANGNRTSGTILESVSSAYVPYPIHPKFITQSWWLAEAKGGDERRKHTTQQSPHTPNHNRHLNQQLRQHEEVEPERLIDEELVVKGLDVESGDVEHEAWD